MRRDILDSQPFLTAAPAAFCTVSGERQSNATTYLPYIATDTSAPLSPAARPSDSPRSQHIRATSAAESVDDLTTEKQAKGFSDMLRQKSEVVQQNRKELNVSHD